MFLKKLLILIVAIFYFAVLVMLARFFISSQVNPLGSLQVDSIPKTEVILDGKQMGQTPYVLEKVKPGEYQLKLGFFEKKLKVYPGALTYVSWEIGNDLETSAGQVLTLEKLLDPKMAELAVISDPDGATVSIDAIEKGRTSAIFPNLIPGDKVVIISKSGFADQIIQARISSGFRLNAIIKLRKLTTEPGRSIKSTAELVSTASAMAASVSAVIKETPLGFLRVRSAPDFTAAEIGKVYPGEKYPIMLQNDNWVEIKWQDKEGWVARDYLLIM